MSGSLKPYYLPWLHLCCQAKRREQRATYKISITSTPSCLQLHFLLIETFVITACCDVSVFCTRMPLAGCCQLYTTAVVACCIGCYYSGFTKLCCSFVCVTTNTCDCFSLSLTAVLVYVSNLVHFHNFYKNTFRCSKSTSILLSSSLALQYKQMHAPEQRLYLQLPLYLLVSNRIVRRCNCCYGCSAYKYGR